MRKRLSAREIADFLSLEPPEIRKTVRALRRTVLAVAPGAAEAIKFHVLAYYHPGAWFGVIGGNICMIEVRKGDVQLSFIRGAELSDPRNLLSGKGKSKRRLSIPDAAFASGREVRALIRAAARLEPWS